MPNRGKEKLYTRRGADTKRKSKTKPKREDTKQVTMPTVSQGRCANALRKSHMCGNLDVELANGLCLTCWDKSTDASPPYSPEEQ